MTHSEQAKAAYPESEWTQRMTVLASREAFDAILAAPSLSLVAVRDEVRRWLEGYAHQFIIDGTVYAHKFSDALFATGILKPSSEAEAAVLREVRSWVVVRSGFDMPRSELDAFDQKYDVRMHPQKSPEGRSMSDNYTPSTDDVQRACERYMSPADFRAWLSANNAAVRKKAIADLLEDIEQSATHGKFDTVGEIVAFIRAALTQTTEDNGNVIDKP